MLRQPTQRAADVLARLLVAQPAAHQAADRGAQRAGDVAEDALWGHLRVLNWGAGSSLEGNEVREGAGDAADLLPELLVAESLADEATEGGAGEAERAAEDALGRHLSACRILRRHRVIGGGSHGCGLHCRLRFI